MAACVALTLIERVTLLGLLSLLALSFATVAELGLWYLSVAAFGALAGEVRRELRASLAPREKPEDKRIVRLRDRYAAGAITIEEFEQGVERVLDPAAPSGMPTVYAGW